MEDGLEQSEFQAIYEGILGIYDDAIKKLGKFNLIVFGDAGAGKSTLVNAFFGMDLAETGIGEPVTEKIERFSRHEGDILTVYDNPGFVLGEATAESMVTDLGELVRGSRTKKIEDQIHAVWFVVNSRNPRFTDAHDQIIRAMAELHLPVVVVLTRVDVIDGEPDDDVLEFAQKIESRGLPLANEGKVIFVNSKVTRTTPAIHGMRELLEATLRMAPDAAKAISITQRVDFSLQRAEARKVIQNFRYVSASAGATAGVPVPLADVGAVALALGTMIARISACYALPIRSSQVAAIATAAVVGVASGHKGVTAAGQWLAKEAAAELAKETARKAVIQAGKELAKDGAEESAKILTERAAREIAKTSGKQLGKFVPLLNVVIGAVGAVSAYVLALSAGHAWMYVCEFLLRRPELLERVDLMTVLRVFQHYFGFRPKKNPPGSASELPDPEHLD